MERSLRRSGPTQVEALPDKQKRPPRRGGRGLESRELDGRRSGGPPHTQSREHAAHHTALPLLRGSSGKNGSHSHYFGEVVATSRPPPGSRRERHRPTRHRAAATTIGAPSRMSPSAPSRNQHSVGNPTSTRTLIPASRTRAQRLP